MSSLWKAAVPLVGMVLALPFIIFQLNVQMQVADGLSEAAVVQHDMEEMNRLVAEGRQAEAFEVANRALERNPRAKKIMDDAYAEAGLDRQAAVAETRARLRGEAVPSKPAIATRPMKRTAGAYYPDEHTDTEAAATSSGGSSWLAMLVAGFGGLFVFLGTGVAAFFVLRGSSAPSAVDLLADEDAV